MGNQLAAISTLLLLSTVSGAAIAQSTQTATAAAPTPTPGQAAGNKGGLEEIIVTATKRSENLQNVPVAVSALSSSMLKNAGVFETSDLNHSMPNLQVASPYGKQQPNFSLRGVGVGTEFNANAASPIGVYVDEVYQSFRASHGQQLYDLEQVEVVRGPQGTLYGRNTTGGAINFITRKPRLEGEEGYATVGYGNYNRVSAEGAVEVTPVPGKFGIRLSGTYVDSDPYVKNVQPAGLNTTVAGGASGLNRDTGKSPGGTQAYGLRLELRWKPVEDVDISLKGYGGEARGNTETPIAIGQTKGSDVISYTNPNFLLSGVFQQLAPLGLVPASYSRAANGLDDQHIQADSVGDAFNQARGVVLNMKFSLTDHLKLISISGYDDAKYSQGPTDCDGTPLRICAINYESNSHSVNQDVRFDYTHGPLKAILGGYYGRDVINTDNHPDFFNFLSDVRAAVGLPATYFNPAGAFNGTALPTTALPTGIRAEQQNKQIRRSLAVYGETSYNVTSTITLTAGLRYTSDKIAYRDGMATYYDDTGTARLITVSDFQQNGVYAPYFLQPVRDANGNIVIPSYQSLGIPLPNGLSKSGSSNRLSGRAIASWKPTPESMIYASYSRGYRGGTFNGLAYSSATQVYFVKPEMVNAYELGFKTRWLSNRLQVNGAFFLYDYKGQQGQVVDATATANLVSLDGTLKGLEIETQFALTRRLTLTASLGLLDSKYAKGACTSVPTGTPAQDGSCVVSSAGAVSVAGNPFPFAPKSSINLGADWRVFDNGTDKLDLHADGAYTGHYYFDSFGNYSQGVLTQVTTGDFANGSGKYWTSNARLTFTHGNYSAAAWVKNLTNQTYFPHGIALENLFATGYRVRAEPRTFGGELTFRW